VEDGPQITATGINHISIAKGDGQDFEIKGTEVTGSDGSASAVEQWEILKPYGEGITADSSKVSELLSGYTAFDFVSCVDYKGEDLSSYGLDNPYASILVGYNETNTDNADTAGDSDTNGDSTKNTVSTPKVFQIYIGSEDGSGNRYVRKEGSNAVYTMSTSSLDTMLNVDAFSLINPYICAPSIDTIDKIEAVIAGKSYTLEIKRTTKKDKDGKDETTAVYYDQGKEVKEDAFKEFYYKLIALKYDAEIKDDVDISANEPYLTVTFHGTGENGGDFTASYLPYDDSFYTVLTGSGVHFFADKRAVDDVAAAILSMGK
jgi:hypothetical protein